MSRKPSFAEWEMEQIESTLLKSWGPIEPTLLKSWGPIELWKSVAPWSTAFIVLHPEGHDQFYDDQLALNRVRDLRADYGV